MSAKIGIADTMFARFDFFKSALSVLEEYSGIITWERYTVPGIKDLPIATLKLLEERGCDIAIAMGMPGPKPVDKISAQVASEALQQVQLMTRKHVIEVFVHEDESNDPKILAKVCHNRARDHTRNAVMLLTNPKWLEKRAGKGIRQGFEDAGPLIE